MIYQFSTGHGIVGISQDSHDLEVWNSGSLLNTDYCSRSDIALCSFEGSADV
jgi:hypothetical protein